MIKHEVDLELLIKSYAINTGKDGVFLSILEFDNNLARILNFSHSELNNMVYKYLYLTDFNNEYEMEEFFNLIENESHPDAQYAVLVKDGEIVREYPEW